MFIVRFHNHVGASNHEFTAKKMLVECILASKVSRADEGIVSIIVENKVRDLYDMGRYSVAVAFWNEFIVGTPYAAEYLATMSSISLDEPMRSI